MADSALVKKLAIKPGYKLLILNAPEGYHDKLNDLPEGVTISTEADGTYDWVQLFAYNIADVDEQAEKAINAVKENGLLWIAYPKKTGKIKTDISRDIGWNVVTKAGWDGVSLVALDDTWSSMRFRPLKDIKSREGVARTERQKKSK